MVKGLRVNVKKEIMISTETTGKIIEKSKFPFAVCKKGVRSYSILCLFCSCWVHNGCSGIRSKLKEDKNFKCQSSRNQQTDVIKAFPDIEINGQALEIVEKFYLDDTIEARWGAADNVIEKVWRR